MKTLWPLLLLCLTSSAGPLFAQETTRQSPRDLLVDCGSEKVVIVPGTQGLQAGLAVAWTLRPNRKRAPVDWSLYDDLGGSWYMLQKFSVDFEHPSDGDYALLDGVVDLKRKVFTPLPSREPYFAGKNHGSLDADWSDEQNGTRYGIMANNGGGHYFERTFELWLVRIDAQGTHFVELTAAADKAVRAYLRKRDPEDAAHYVWKYDFQGDDFQGRKLSVHFDAEIPVREDIDDGVVHFILPAGTVIGTTKK